MVIQIRNARTQNTAKKTLSVKYVENWCQPTLWTSIWIYIKVSWVCPFRCSDNNFLFASVDIRPFKCKAEGCEKYFHSPGNSRQHYKKVHVDSITRPYKCDVCGSGFIQKSSLDLHRSYHFDPQMPCPICGKLFRNKYELFILLLTLTSTVRVYFSDGHCKNIHWSILANAIIRAVNARNRFRRVLLWERICGFIR